MADNENTEYTLQNGTDVVAAQGYRTAKDIVTNSSQQIFDNFIKRNFDEKQQEEIREQIDTALQESGGNCTITWQGEDKKDKVEVTYVDDKMTKFEMNNRTVGDDFNARQHIEYKQTDNYARVVTKEKHKFDGKTTKLKCSVKAYDGRDFKAKDSRSVSSQNLDIGGLQYTSSSQKNTRKLQSTDNGYDDRYTTTDKSVKLGAETGVNVSGHSQTTHYNEAGGEINQTGSDNSLYAGTRGIEISHLHNSRTTTENGTVYSESGVELSFKNGMATVTAGAEKTITDTSGNVIYDRELGGFVGIGAGVAGGMHHKLQTPDAISETDVTLHLQQGHVGGELGYVRGDQNNNIKKRMHADFNAYKKCIAAGYEVQHTTDGKNSIRNLAFEAKYLNRSGSMTLKKEQISEDGISSTHEIKGEIYAQSLSRIGVSVEESHDKDVRNILKADTRKAYDKINKISGGIVGYTEQIIQGINGVKDGAANTLQTAQNNISQNPLNNIIRTGNTR